MTDHRRPDYSPFAPQAAQPPQPSTVVFVVTREKASTFDTLTGSLRPIDNQGWEALYLRNGDLYLSQTCGTRARAEAHLAQRCEALEAAGWTRQAVKGPAVLE
jgi:hypothetical protein